ncbi:MAG: Menaquinone reductase, integral membrane subunit [Anaerolineales bacterium]|nr:polysulfide reductase NrfD [Anaerolineae bacterium]MBL8106774.1 polysulfide reductase NrfD [Anaerolineales bacterium]MBV6399801.1 Menaquinone reductase, integral membrane subunit [Anaerolineales bacterium]MCC7190120.1 polysulfide reductase NrfD [Anaerolineales bacterium]
MQTDIHIPRFRFGKKSVDIFPYWIGLLTLGILFGMYGAFVVLRDGLDVTGLTNKVPWGLWVVMDLASISLGGSAFVFGVIVYLMKLKRFEIVAKLAVLLGFLGYTTAGMVIWFDLGQPFRFWHPMVFWQPHSLLWEITMCVILYLGVLSAEILPVVVEHSFFYEHSLHKRYPIVKKLVELAKKLAHWLHKLVPVLAVVGLTLSLLHQASLGAYYSVLNGRGVWFNQSAPVQFVFSAMSGGVAFLFFTGVIMFRVMRPGLVKDEILYDVARLSGGITLLLTYLRLWDWAVTYYYSFDVNIALQTEALNAVAPYSSTFWIGQILLPIIAGAAMFSAKSIKSFRYLMVFSLFPMAATVLTRWNYNFAGLIAMPTYDPYTPIIRVSSYIPTWPEFAVASLVVSYWLLAFSFAARYLPFKGPDTAH